MSEDGPSKHDLTTVFKKLRSIPANKVCFDCGAKNPTWCSVTYGVFICIDCSAIHRGLGVHVSFVRSSTLDTNWTWLQLRAMQLGGNGNATQFLRQHGCTSTDAQQKYKSRAATLYREKLHHSASAAMRLHGTKLMIEGTEQLSPAAAAEKDFFSDDAMFTPVVADIPRNDSNLSFNKDAMLEDDQANGDSDGPSVDHLDKTEAGHHEAPKKAAIGRKTGPKKTGMGAKKAGKFGAQKVTSDFSEIEKQAENLDKEREEALASRFKPVEAPESEVQQLSARLMVQDISKEREKEEERMKRMDPKKVEQVERLGMGFKSDRGGVSHSIASDMRTIQQDGVRAKTGYGGARVNKDFEEDEWEILSQPKRNNNIDDFSDLGSKKKTSTLFDEDDYFTASSSASWDTTEEPRKSSKSSTQAYQAPASDGDALKKFGNAKAISSDQYFGDKADFETRANLTKYEGATGIGSAEFFGGGSGASSGGSGSYATHMPEVADIKDSVRQGVSKVAGKLSSLSSSVQGYMSENYGY